MEKEITAHEIYLFVYCLFDAFWCQIKTQCLKSLILIQITSQHQWRRGVILHESHKNVIHIPRGYGVFGDVGFKKVGKLERTKGRLG